MVPINGFKTFVVFSIFPLILFLGSGAKAQCAADFISTPSEVGASAFHYHMVSPGSITTYIIRVKNIWDKPADIELSTEAEKADGWTIQLSETRISGMKPNDYRDLLLTVRPSAALKSGEILQLKVVAVADGAFKDVCTVAAETSLHKKIYFVSIDSLHPDYIKLNAAGTGPGKEGDWLMPNLHRMEARSVFYPNAKVHIISATDMNHFNYLAGTMTGTAGIPLVGAAFFGFDEKGNPIIVGNKNLKSEITLYGDGKIVKTILNSAKAFNQNLWTAFASGKNWVPEMLRFPDYQLDRIINGTRVPEWLLPIKSKDKEKELFFQRSLKPLVPDPVIPEQEALGNPAGLKAKQDRRETRSAMAFVEGKVPVQFPSDRWVMDASLLELINEDPDVFYVLLATVDDAGHAFGAASDPSEWNDGGTPSVNDDVSKYDPRASRQGILNVVREADAQLGRFLDLLQTRGTLEQAIIVVESDHNMLTHYQKPLDMRAQLRKSAKYSWDKDYFFGAATAVGMVAARRDDPKIIEDVERALESWRVKNPVTGEEECPVIVYDREEMKTGFDKATGKQWMLPNEYYSKYYVEHRKPGQIYWADLLVLANGHYKFKLQNFGLGNLGMANLKIKLPEWGYFIGGHGNFDTQAAVLMLSVPGTKAAVLQDQVYAMDVAPTLERLEGWQIPESTDGKGLPGLDPSIK